MKITIFTVQDRQNALDFIQKITKECDQIAALVQVGSGAKGFTDAYSDLDFVIALDTAESMLSVMDYMHQKITEKYEVVYFSQEETRHLQCYVLSNLLEIDIGFGSYQNAAAWKPAFKVLWDSTGVVEDKMITSREWMDNVIFGDKQKKDVAAACDSVWARLMHASVAIRRGNFLRAVGELENARKMYIDLLGNRYRLESGLNREMDKLPENEKVAIKSTFVMSEKPEDLWTALKNLTELVYKELEGNPVAITKDMLYRYYDNGTVE
ncbi:MAG: nucleotidyltransferase domain-containing protein [Treponema sp.]|nr:nucleotidyltransferase domain-containing protein [Candidatus Treponema caballi]